MMRVQKYLSEAGVASRRAAEELIAAGRVFVNGEPAQVGQSVDPEVDRVEVDGKPVRPEEKKVYVLLNKPLNVISSAKDTHGRKTVLDYVQTVGVRVFPVGRLDFDSEGALLLTNDGELAHRLMHPSYEVDKVYLARVRGSVAPETAQRLERGVELDDGVTAPAKVEVLQVGEGWSRLKLTLREGRKREVRRMCAAVGHPVRELQRVRIGAVELKSLKPGQWRHLSARELGELRRAVGLGEEG